MIDSYWFEHIFKLLCFPDFTGSSTELKLISNQWILYMHGYLIIPNESY